MRPEAVRQPCQPTGSKPRLFVGAHGSAVVHRKGKPGAGGAGSYSLHRAPEADFPGKTGTQRFTGAPNCHILPEPHSRVRHKSKELSNSSGGGDFGVLQGGEPPWPPVVGRWRSWKPWKPWKPWKLLETLETPGNSWKLLETLHTPGNS